jgi:hypothetical protein
MAYDFFPKNVEELRKKTNGYPAKQQGELYLLYTYLKNKYPKLETPINLDIQKKGKVNVSRQLQEDTTIKKIQAGANISLSLKFGNGSSGNRGVNNRGNLFEPEFAKALLDWWSGNKVSDIKMLNAIEDLDKTYKLRKSKKFKVDILGGENTRRPIIYQPKIHLDNPKGSGYDVGKSVTDITLTTDKQSIFLSLKLGTTTTFFNVGIRTVLPPDDIKAYNIQNPNGKKLLELFNIDEKVFCDVFNGKLSRGYSQNVTPKPGAMDELMKTGIGKGYHIIHKMTGKIISKKMDDTALRKAAKVNNVTIFYGGKTGTGKRIDMEMESSTYKFKLNIRDTQGGDGYPTRLMCDFSYK